MRKKTVLTLEDRGRPLVFEIREMSAHHLEKWLAQVCQASGQAASGRPSGNDLHAAALRLRNNFPHLLMSMEYHQARPLMDELLTCCTRLTTGQPAIKQPVRLDNVDSFIEDVTTLFQLRLAALRFNLEFLPHRLPVEFPVLPGRESSAKTIGYVNVSHICGTIVSRGLATLRELETFYSYDDALNMLEIIRVDNHNDHAQVEANRKPSRR